MIFLVDLDFFREAQIVRHAHHHDAVENRFVGMIRFKLLPLVLHSNAPRSPCRRKPGRGGPAPALLFLSCGDHAVQVFDLVFKHLDKLDETAVADVERAVQFQHSGIALGVKINLEISSLPISTEVSWLFGSTGGTTPMPTRERLENSAVQTGNSSYLPSYS